LTGVTFSGLVGYRAVDKPLIIRRREISEHDLQLIRRLIEEEGSRGRTHLSKRLCEIWDWRQPNGRFRQIACRDLLRRLHAKGLIQLPAMLQAARRPGYRNRVVRSVSLDQSPLVQALGRLAEPVQLSRVESPEQREVFKGLIGGFHYLGYRQPTGAQIKYLAHCGNRPLACLSFGPAAYKVAARDAFIGWSPEQRQERLYRVVDNDRFLILPWVRMPGLASFLLSRCLRRLRRDWRELYGHDLALVETFIETARFRGTCYAAANWMCVGQTRGRGRNDRFNRLKLPIKSLWLRPLRRDFRQVLCAS